mmetsp:Transcript_35287/g.89310  ORF Transcript_35287/g.89310 Transcript_35287/m.89310 type:complete len:200 (+) Transcript_35287:467-1066(+)
MCCMPSMVTRVLSLDLALATSSRLYWYSVRQSSGPCSTSSGSCTSSRRAASSWVADTIDSIGPSMGRPSVRRGSLLICAAASLSPKASRKPSVKLSSGMWAVGASLATALMAASTGAGGSMAGGRRTSGAHSTRPRTAGRCPTWGVSLALLLISRSDRCSVSAPPMDSPSTKMGTPGCSLVTLSRMRSESSTRSENFSK